MVSPRQPLDRRPSADRLAARWVLPCVEAACPPRAVLGPLETCAESHGRLSLWETVGNLLRTTFRTQVEACVLLLPLEVGTQRPRRPRMV